MPTYGSRVQLLSCRISTLNRVATSYGASAQLGSPPGAPLATPTTVRGGSSLGWAAGGPPTPGGPGYSPTKCTFLPMASPGAQPNRRACSAVRITSYTVSLDGRRPATRMSARGVPDSCLGRPTIAAGPGFAAPS